jgi:nucleoid-associated protein YgaU
MSNDPASRHDSLGTYEVVLAPGAEPVELYEPRTIPEPPRSVAHRVVASDRFDLLAYRYFGDSHQYWRIADANPALTPEDVLDPGAVISIPAKK